MKHPGDVIVMYIYIYPDFWESNMGMIFSFI